MTLRQSLLLASLLPLPLGTVFARKANFDLDAAPHRYHERELRDPFTLLKGDLESGKVVLDESSEHAFLLSLLARLKVPVSSQMLVFSTTSLQLRLIRPDNPRALYFNEDVHVGYIPGGRIEIVSLDPELGGIFYIFDIPRGGAPIRAERSERCMRCHADDDTSGVPGIVIKSVAPGIGGGSLDSFRRERTGHDIPFSERFGGWYVTGKSAIKDHWGNAIGKFAGGEVVKYPIDPTKQFNPAKYPLPTSDILPQLVQEHQAGFVNRVTHAAYQFRGLPPAPLNDAASREVDEVATGLTRYILFADEVPLPKGGVEGDAQYRKDFAQNRKAAPNGASLKDFDLKTRLFRYRCSYMIYAPSFQSLPPVLKQRVYAKMGRALSPVNGDPAYAYLPAPEKQAISAILDATLPGYR